jgi:hypothetical protein
LLLELITPSRGGSITGSAVAIGESFIQIHCHWIDDSHFHWQSQNATDPSSKRGQEIIRHATLGIDIHLFVRENKLAAGKAAPFTYHGRVVYQSHQGSQPMSVVFGLQSGAG